MQPIPHCVTVGRDTAVNLLFVVQADHGCHKVDDVSALSHPFR